MNDPQLWDSMIEIHKQGVVVGTLLGGFTMSTAFQSFSKPWQSDVHKYTSIAAFISSVAFICMVCVSALVLFVFSDYEFQVSSGREAISNRFFITLATMNLGAGVLGVLSLFTMFALLGWEKSSCLGWLTTTASIVGILFLLIAFFVVYYKYQLPIYGNLPSIPGL